MRRFDYAKRQTVTRGPAALPARAPAVLCPRTLPARWMPVDGTVLK